MAGGSQFAATAQLLQQAPAEFAAFYDDPVLHPPSGAEPAGEFRQRVANVFEGLLSDYAGQRVLVIAHAGVMRAVISQLLDTPLRNMFRIKVENAARVRILTEGRAQLVLRRSLNRRRY